MPLPYAMTIMYVVALEAQREWAREMDQLWRTWSRYGQNSSD